MSRDQNTPKTQAPLTRGSDSAPKRRRSFLRHGWDPELFLKALEEDELKAEMNTPPGMPKKQSVMALLQENFALMDEVDAANRARAARQGLGSPPLREEGRFSEPYVDAPNPQDLASPMGPRRSRATGPRRDPNTYAMAPEARLFSDPSAHAMGEEARFMDPYADPPHPQAQPSPLRSALGRLGQGLRSERPDHATQQDPFALDPREVGAQGDATFLSNASQPIPREGQGSATAAPPSTLYASGPIGQPVPQRETGFMNIADNSGPLPPEQSQDYAVPPMDGPGQIQTRELHSPFYNQEDPIPLHWRHYEGDVPETLNEHAMNYFGLDKDLIGRNDYLPRAYTPEGERTWAVPNSVIGFAEAALWPDYLLLGGSYANWDAFNFALNFGTGGLVGKYGKQVADEVGDILNKLRNRYFGHSDTVIDDAMTTNKTDRFPASHFNTTSEPLPGSRTGHRDKDGKFVRDPENRKVHARFVAGGSGKDNKVEFHLTMDQLHVLAEDLTGTKVEYVARGSKHLGTSLGKVQISPTTGKPMRISIDETLPPEQARLVLAHEVGHAIDRTVMAVRKKNGMYLDDIRESLQDIYHLSRGGHPGAKHKFNPGSYGYPLESWDAEYVAEAIRMYLTAPDRIKENFPEVAARIRSYVNKTPRLNYKIHFNSVAPVGAVAIGQEVAIGEEDE